MGTGLYGKQRCLLWSYLSNDEMCQILLYINKFPILIPPERLLIEEVLNTIASKSMVVILDHWVVYPCYVFDSVICRSKGLPWLHMLNWSFDPEEEISVPVNCLPDLFVEIDVLIELGIDPEQVFLLVWTF